ncbi:MAG: aspartate kinase [Bacillota bacterium]
MFRDHASRIWGFSVLAIAVLKFGGTSVASEESRQLAVARVRAHLDKGYDVCVVVSAMGRKGEPYATDTLLGLARSLYHNTAPRELDLMAACGEIISSVVMTNALRREGIRALALTGWQAGIVTDTNFTQARIRRVEPSHLQRHLKEGFVVVVAGFQGQTESGDITTLGRGGSDISAVALGVALEAQETEIYTDVDGVLTADPRVVPDARTIPSITYDELCQFAHEGAKVIHPVAVELARRYDLQLHIRSTFSDSMGTTVTGQPLVGGHPRTVTGVTSIGGMVQVQVDFGPDQGSGDELRLFKALADQRISLDMILVTPGRKAFIVAEGVAQEAQDVMERAGFFPSIRPGCAKVSVIGAGMRGVPGVMAAVASALHDAGVRILQTADSHLSISCLVPQEHSDTAVRALHGKFHLSQ